MRNFRLFRDEDGQTLVTSVGVIITFIAFVGLLADGGLFMFERRNLQGVADAAALAGVRELPTSTTLSRAVAEEYAGTNNNSDGANVRSIVFSENSSRIRVIVEKQSPATFSAFFGVTDPTIDAVATAEVAQASAAEGYLPLAMMRDSFTLNQTTEIKTDGSSQGNRGIIRPPAQGEPCLNQQGADDYRKFVLGTEYGGVDACGIAPGDTIQTETGSKAGPTRDAFGDRIGTNTQSFSDVFELDARTGRYVVKDPDSPRLGIIPIIENTNGTNTWPNGSQNIKVLRYLLVYIGKMDQPPDYPAFTNNGQEVWVTPVASVAPPTLAATYVTGYDASNPAPIAYRLVE